MDNDVQDLADRQDRMVSRAQLMACGIDADQVRNQCAAQRWSLPSATVVSMFTGELTARQRCWLGVLHGGKGSLVAGRTAAQHQGLKRWEAHVITIVVDHRRSLEPIPGVRFVRTRRKLADMALAGTRLPMCRIEPALLFVAAYDLSKRAGQGILAAAVQQKLTTPEKLTAEIDKLKPLRRAPLFRDTLTDITGGAQSVGEMDVATMCDTCGLPRPVRQMKRRDAAGRARYTDCEWDLPGGHTVVLEVDGGFHMEVEHWVSDMERERGLVSPTRHILRCSTRELRDSPLAIAQDLKRMGVR